MNFANPDDASPRALLDRTRTIAVVGLSPQHARPSYLVARAMQRYGYRIVPVRPQADEVLGERAYADLADIPFKIDLVNVFRAAEHLPAIVEQCLALHLPAIWIQEGIPARKAARRQLGCPGAVPHSSHVICILVRKEDMRPGSDYTEHMMRDVHKLSDEAIARHHQFYPQFRESDFRLQEPRALFDWACRQAYIPSAT